ncbi:MAG: DUF1549 domain-containing protein [Acidobacteria bacterium]|nr:DUF1549 domain-containing protein [Acidobacteriota bacterium]
MKVLPFAAIWAAAMACGADVKDLFQSKIYPAFKQDCFGCHGESQTSSRLDLRTREAMLRGGARGPAILPGNAAGSWLVKVMEGGSGLQMPPGSKPNRELVAAIREWIDGGAPWADPKADIWSTYKPEDLWAFRPLRPRDRTKTIDTLIGKPAPRAGKRDLIRRVSIDLTGLPPSPQEIDAFLKDTSANAWSKLVDRLLASPTYGERWGRHWLDVVRYADTNGYSNDFERPNAWRYRDYVIRSFNSDKPYDRFVREQIAGDELYPGDPEALIATGFLRAGPWEHTGMSVEAVTRQMFLDDVTHATASTFLGLTLGCARCHDHKFDPIPTRDYYRMQAVFATTEFARPKVPFLPEENVGDLAEGKGRMQQVAEMTRSKMEAMGGKNYQDGRRLPPDKFEEFKLYQKHAALYKESLDRYEPKAFAVSSGPRDGETDGGANMRYAKRAEYKPASIHILPGGNIQAPAEKVTPGLLSSLEKYGEYPSPEVPDSVERRRAVLANWVADARNPLTPRVMANRVWQYHFGKGIAADTSNFGKMGQKPENSELLDWLAAAFIEDGWSLKSLHRRILLSNAYQSTNFAPRRIEAETLRDSVLQAAGELSSDRGGPGTFPDINEDVARQPQHRMGSLSPVYRPSALKRQRNRRTVYTFQQRSLMDPMIEVFNGASMDLSCERRDASTVPTQAFTMFNSRWMHDMSLALAARVEKERATPVARLSELFVRVYGRRPRPDELKTAMAAYANLLKQHTASTPVPRETAKPVVHMITSELTGEQHRFVQQDDPVRYEHNLHPSEASPQARAMADVALALFNSNEFVYVY